MEMFKDTISLQTEKEGEVVDITKQCQNSVDRSGFSNGILFLFVPGSTATLTTIEFEEGLVEDLPSALDRIAPKNLPYKHEEAWHDGNGRSHVKASLMKPDLFIPISDGKLTIGVWQQIVFIELDIRPRARKIVAQVMGD